MTTVPTLVSTEEAARLLGVSAGYLNNLRVKGGGPSFIKIGTRVSYDQSDLVDWLASRKRSSTSDAGPEA